MRDTSASFTAKWTSKEVTCCDKVILEGFLHSPQSNGIYKLDPDTQQFKQENGNKILHQKKGKIGWFVGEDTEPGSGADLKNDVGFCIYYI